MRHSTTQAAVHRQSAPLLVAPQPASALCTEPSAEESGTVGPEQPATSAAGESEDSKAASGSEVSATPCGLPGQQHSAGAFQDGGASTAGREPGAAPAAGAPPAGSGSGSGSADTGAAGSLSAAAAAWDATSEGHRASPDRQHWAAAPRRSFGSAFLPAVDDVAAQGEAVLAAVQVCAFLNDSESTRRHDVASCCPLLLTGMTLSACGSGEPVLQEAIMYHARSCAGGAGGNPCRHAVAAAAAAGGSRAAAAI